MATRSTSSEELFRLASGARVFDGDADGVSAGARTAEASPPAEPGRPRDSRPPTHALEVSGSGALADFDVVTVSESNSGPFDASEGNFIYDLRPGDYTVRLENFGTGDIFVPFPDFSVSFPEETDQSDGVQPIAFTDTGTGETVTLELAGLSADEDASLADLESIDSTFGSGSFGEGLLESGSGTSGGADAATETISGDVLVDGAPAQTIPESASTLTIASTDSGTVELADGKARTFSSNDAESVTLGAGEGFFGALTLAGAGTRLIASGTQGGVDVGRAGAGAFSVRGGAELAIDGAAGSVPGLTVGRNAGSNAKLKVAGNGSRIDVSADNDVALGGSSFIAVGGGGAGFATVENGGVIANDSGGATFVGRDASATGIVTLRDSGTLLDAGAKLLIGAGFDAESGSVELASGGTGRVTVQAGARLEAGTPNDGEADIVVGAGDTLRVHADASLVGDVLNEGGTVDIASGATFEGERLGIDGAAPSVSDATFSVGENAAAGTVVGTVAASDDESVTGLTIVDGGTDVDDDGNAPFALATDGTLTVNDADDLDPASQASFTLTVQARDAAGNTGTGAITVEVSAVDTTPPSVGDATFDVQDTAQTGTAVGTVEASDDIEVTTLAITDGNTDVDGDGQAAFSLADDGTLTVNDADDLDAGTQASFGLTVEASDDAGNTATGTVTVNVSAASDGFTDTQEADTLTGTNEADTLALIADGQNDSFDAKDDFARDTLDLSGLDPTQLGDVAPTVDLREGFVETAISGRDSIANFDTVIGTSAADELLGRDEAGGFVTGADTALPARFTEIVDQEKFVDGGGADTVGLRGGQGVVTLSPDATVEADLTASSSGGLSENALDLSRATGGVQVDLGAQGTDAVVVSGGGVGDQPGTTVSGFDSVEGSDFDDVLNAPRIVIDGDGADDVTLTSGSEGLLYLSADGVQETNITGQGASGLNFLAASSGVTVDLSAQGSEQLVVSGGGVGDQSGTTITGFNGVAGSSNADTLIGNSGSNRLDGSAGDDEIDAGAGDDAVEASDGSDTLTGGSGADDFDPLDFFSPSTGINQIADFDAGQGDLISLGKFGGFATAEDLAVELRPNATLPDFSTDQDGFFTDADGSGEVPNVLVFDNGNDLTRIVIDGNGDGNYRPSAFNDEDSAIDVTGTIESTGIDADAFAAL